MAYVTIHESGQGAEKMEIQSWYNGGAYSVHFGGDGSPMRTLFFQGDDATLLRAELDTLEAAEPETDTRDLWFRVLDLYLD
jgi:hypothetical protein